MNSTIACLSLLAGLLLPLPAAAQEAAPGACPQLPAGAGLVWESRGMGASDFCRALRSDGSEAFGLYISPEPNFRPSSRNREESGQVDGQQVTWYRAEIAGDPGVQARETLMPLADGRHAHIWLQSDSEAGLARGYQLISQLRFAPGDQVAGN